MLWKCLQTPLDRHLKCHRTITNSASSLALTFPLLQSLKPPPFLRDTWKLHVIVDESLSPIVFSQSSCSAHSSLTLSLTFNPFSCLHSFSLELLWVYSGLCSPSLSGPLLTWFSLLRTPLPMYVYLLKYSLFWDSAQISNVRGISLPFCKVQESSGA